MSDENPYSLQPLDDALGDLGTFTGTTAPNFVDSLVPRNPASPSPGLSQPPSSPSEYFGGGPVNPPRPGTTDAFIRDNLSGSLGNTATLDARAQALLDAWESQRQPSNTPTTPAPTAPSQPVSGGSPAGGPTPLPPGTNLDGFDAPSDLGRRDAVVDQIDDDDPFTEARPYTPPPTSLYDGDFIPNPLTAFAQVAYNFKFFVEKDGREIIIAQTGVTGYNIKDVEIENVVAQSSTMRSTVATRFAITIVEPLGSSFFDGWYQATRRLGIENWQKSPYKLELTFKGYDESGRPVGGDGTITEGLPNGGRWVWNLIIKDVDTHLDASGTEYKITGVPRDEVALDNTIMILQAPIQAKGSTVGEFFESMKEGLNAAMAANYGDAYINYDFVFHKEDGGDADPSSWVLEEADDLPFNNFMHREMDAESKETITANLTRGMKIVDVITTVLGVTKEAQDRIVDGDREVSGLNKEGRFRTSTIYRIYPEVAYGEYNPVVGNYRKNVIFHVKPFRTQATILSAEEVAKAQENSSRALSALHGLEALRKQYEYIFTGMNTEVVQFDARFKFAWEAVVMRMDGQNYYNEQIPGVQAALIKDGPEESEQQDFQNAPSSDGGGDGSIYAEDLTTGTDGSPMPVSTRHGVEGPRHAAGTGMIGSWTRGRSIFGAIMNQVNEGVQRDLMSIDLQIRGDPYWLGYETENYLYQKPSGQWADYTKSDQCFVLRIRYPFMQGEGTQPVLRDQDVFNGVYRAVTATHSFTNGNFTQKIRGVRLPLILPPMSATATPGATNNSFGFE